MSNFFNCELHGQVEFISNAGDYFTCRNCVVDAHAALSHGVKIDQFVFVLNAEAQTANWILMPRTKIGLKK